MAGASAGQEAGAPQPSASAGPAATSSPNATAFEAAPGIPLPAKGIVWVLDTAEGKPAFVRASFSQANFNRHVGENIARTQFFLKSVATLELPGAAAKLRVSIRTPIIYVRKSVEEEEELQIAATGPVKLHYVLSRAQVTDNRRVMLGFSAAPFYGRYNRKKDYEVEILTEDVAAGQWVKITPKQPLADGEYAFNQMPEDKKLIETLVYDFGIGAPAPQPPQNEASSQ